MSKIYSVYGSKSSYSDYTEWTLKAFKVLERAEEYRRAAEKWLLESGLFFSVQNGVWTWDWDGDSGLTPQQQEALMASNPFDPSTEYAETGEFHGYSIEELELED